MSRIDETIQAKTEKRAALEKLDISPHPYSYNKTHTVAQARESKGQSVQTAGRIMSIRAHGRVIFLDLQDPTGSIQVMVRKTEENTNSFDWLKTLVDRGDFLGVTGTVDITQTGELTIIADTFEFLGKSLRPLPSEWNAAEDKEARFRKRYLDMLINPETRRVLDARWLIIKEVRRYLQDQHDFIEVDTPVFHPLYGGTNAKPFHTYMNALDSMYYLRLAPELYLKRLIIGGYDKIFEIARNFRNEGIDQTHQPEFTMIEWYHAYSDYNTMMDVAEGLLKHLITKLYGNSILKVGETEIEVGRPWPRITMIDAVFQYTGIDFNLSSDEELLSILNKNGIELQSEFSRGKALFAIFDKLVTGYLIEPVWIIDYPRDISPLAKAHRLNPEFAERFECYIGGKELADGWSEITDSIDQRNIFSKEQKNMRSGDTEAHPMDEDFLEAMEYGMPPLSGIGMGIDRLVMFLTNTWSIKEVIAFPTLKPMPWQQVGLAKLKGAVKEAKIATKPNSSNTQQSITLPPREQADALLHEHIKNDKLAHHCYMVAQAMEAYAKELGEDTELWYQTGLLHDIDWEEYPDEHPNKAIAEWLSNYPQEMKDAIAAHAPDRTGKHAETVIEQYLFACDELSGLMHAYSLMRPEGFKGMEVKSVKKKLKDKAFAANVSRDDITQGMEMIGKTPEEHIGFLITVFARV